jgi:hypothetical protein
MSRSDAALVVLAVLVALLALVALVRDRAPAAEPLAAVATDLA